MLPTNLSPWHLDPTWLFWLVLALLLTKMAWMGPNILRYLRQPAAAAAPSPWAPAARDRKMQRMAALLTLVFSAATLFSLMALSALAFYCAAANAVPRVMRFWDEMPHASGGEQIGTVIGGLIGGLAQVALIMGAVASLDPTSDFPFRLKEHLSDVS